MIVDELVSGTLFVSKRNKWIDHIAMHVHICT